ncbi:RNA polymerase, sigma-24 subunit, ECF subfamily [Gloeothece citriformis PCC 7424]|uniref:RNA polymerase, sigma-24 subunit, ECF subfamily n=1 Tax=Gloeothece citriformis (strain PCC 7424) TaxID=65393 RepID=B7KDZ7_GLOC7|nr:sigma-70 family RNA polymerase sigma factor [Gloeothece citriformis]ACK71695.1 RNA polymerase, sigma-24 subunit, ECF subfamily [Gloeothece citriformis PCC 7424]
MRKQAIVLADNVACTPESELIVRCQRGDRTAFHQLYRRYQQKVSSTLYQLCGREMLEDLVQEVFIRVWKGLPKLRQPSYFSTWLYRICWNVAVDGRRQFAKRKQEKRETSTDKDDLSSLETLFRSQDTPDLMQLHYQDLVQRGLQTLSLDHRAVIVLHDLEDIPQKEIAQILQLPVGTVKSRLHYARNAIKKFLQQEGVLS